MRNIWRDAILGVVVGDALGCPVQFYEREHRKIDPVKGMRGFGVFDVPAGSWTDDSSLTLATMDSILKTGCVSVNDVAERFADWYFDGKYTPYGYAYDIGKGTSAAIEQFNETGRPLSGSKDIRNNGNGSLMRIMPVCLYNALEMVEFEKAMCHIDDVSSITHGHVISQTACELYYLVVREILEGEKDPRRILKNAMTFAKTTYEDYDLIDYLDVFGRVLKVDQFLALPEDEIKSTGYVVDSLEAAFWCFGTTDNYADCVLKAVNLGGDTDTIAAIAGGLAGLLYGEDGIPAEWVDVIASIDEIKGMCDALNDRFHLSV